MEVMVEAGCPMSNPVIVPFFIQKGLVPQELSSEVIQLASVGVQMLSFPNIVKERILAQSSENSQRPRSCPAVMLIIDSLMK